MLSTPPVIPVPLSTDEHGTIRVGHTRVTLQTVITAFQQGDTPEQIVDSFDVLVLADVYAVITYYLNHHQEVNAYISQQRETADATLREIEARQPQMFSLRARLLAQLTEKDS